MKKQRGFTLIEILIVVIILAVLASMTLPRFLSQTENAYIAEAQQVLGVLRRAEANAEDMGIGLKTVTDATDSTQMAALGLKPLTQTNFTYTCSSAGKCKALSKRDTGNSVELSMDGEYTCTGYTYVDTTATTKGCKPSA